MAHRNGLHPSVAGCLVRANDRDVTDLRRTRIRAQIGQLRYTRVCGCKHNHYSKATRHFALANRPPHARMLPSYPSAANARIDTRSRSNATNEPLTVTNRDYRHALLRKRCSLVAHWHCGKVGGSTTRRFLPVTTVCSLCTTHGANGALDSRERAPRSRDRPRDGDDTALAPTHKNDKRPRKRAACIRLSYCDRTPYITVTDLARLRGLSMS